MEVAEVTNLIELMKCPPMAIRLMFRPTRLKSRPIGPRCRTIRIHVQDHFNAVKAQRGQQKSGKSQAILQTICSQDKVQTKGKITGDIKLHVIKLCRMDIEHSRHTLHVYRYSQEINRR
jgi:hypothetical protein